MSSRILIGDCRARMAELPDASVDSVVCDPPYHLTSIVKRFGSPNAAPAKVGATGAFARASKGFMGQTWDGGDVAFDPETWAEVLRVLKPGGHLIAFSGTRTYHRMAVAIEDAGFEIRDQLAWVYGSGFPKSLDVSKQIDKAAGAEREVLARIPRPNSFDDFGQGGGGYKAQEQVISAPATDAAREWQGWGTALKPSWEPICLARKPLAGTVAQTVLTYGTGALNIDGCRIEGEERPLLDATAQITPSQFGAMGGSKAIGTTSLGRWPANLCHDGSEEVLAGFPETTSNGGGTTQTSGIPFSGQTGGRNPAKPIPAGDSGSAARFFYTAKATGEERADKCNICGFIGVGSGPRCECFGDDGKPDRLSHPTVKPVALMRWLVRLVTPRGGTVLDPFMGSGSTLLAAEAEQFNAIGCEMSEEYAAIAESRLKAAGGMFADIELDRAA